MKKKKDEFDKMEKKLTLIINERDNTIQMNQKDNEDNQKFKKEKMDMEETLNKLRAELSEE